ncbi:Na+:solute symporter [Candidatus Sumerlaeota bacterium]|nr:Na+:solute symporter [Candidatus Sumerlaeota bacterium]
MNANDFQLVCHLKLVDWLIVISFILISIMISVLLSRRARRSTRDYFKSGEGLSWWLLGTSMVATTFASDTPLALAGMVVTSGIAQNWYWWCGIPIVMVGVFYFACLWKRANPLTDMEFISQRYSGKSASFLRGFKALWMSLVHGVVIMGWVNLAMTTVIRLVWPVIPRIMIVDGLMMTLFLSTPLSKGIDKNIKSAVKRGEIKPMEIAYKYHILRDPVLWTEINAGVYRDREEKALQLLGINERITIDSLDGFSSDDIPPFLYRKQKELKEETSGEKVAPEDLTWPVILADGTSVDHENITGKKSINPITFEIGEKILAADSVKGKNSTAPLRDFTSLQFLSQIYNITSSVNQYKILFILFIITCLYVAIGGLWGVVVTDFIQFWIAMIGCIVMGFLAIHYTGGMKETLTRMVGIYGLDRARAMTSFFPTFSGGKLGMMSIFEFFIYALVIWWAVGFTDGGGSFAQRMLSAKDERHAALGYLWYGVSHFALRMWPWIMVGFAAAVLFPYVAYQNGAYPPTHIAEQGYVKTMILVLPAGMLGLIVASFLAAYMSTISTSVNLGASYLMNDFYRPFIAPYIEAKRRKRKADFKLQEKHFVKMGIFFTMLNAVLGIAISLWLNSIKEAWFLLSAMTSGIGLIYLLRWYWHRINAWTEVTCMTSVVFFTAVMWVLADKFDNPALSPANMWPYNVLVLAPLSVGLALLVTLLTKPDDHEHLKSFYKKVQPGGPGWRDIDLEIRKENPSFKARSPLTLSNFIHCILSTVTVFCFLFGIGKIVIGDTLYPDALVSNRLVGVLLILLGLLCGYFVVSSFEKKKWTG